MSTRPEPALSREELAAVLASAMDAIIAIDETQHIVLFNEAAGRMFGCSVDDALGSHVERFIPPRFREEHRKHIDRYARTGTTNRRMGALGDVCGLREDGRELPLEASISQIGSGNPKLLTVVLRDLTKKRRLEETIRKEQDFARRLLDTAHAIVLVLDTSGRIVQYNGFMRDLCGYDLEEVRGRDWFDTFVPAADRGRLRERFLRSVQGSRTQGSVSEVTARDGSTRIVRWWDAELREGDGPLTGLLCIGHEITEQREAQQDAEFLAALVLSSSDAIIGRTLEGTIVTWNRAAEEILGYSSAEVVGRSVTFLFPEDRMAEHAEIMDRVRAGETVRRFETRRLRKDGTPIDVSISASPILDSSGNVAAAAILLHDITEEKRAREAEADLARIIEGSLNEIYVCDAHTLRFLAVNRGARENLGYSLEEVLGLTIFDLKTELSREQFEGLVAPLRSGDREKVEFEATHRRKDGTHYPVEVNLQRGRYEGVESFVAVIVDITERKAAAQREFEAERRARRLEALASISTLTAGIAHDVGAPMTAILGYAEMMEKSLADEKNRRRARIIIEQIQRISQLVQALLDMARPGERTFVPVDLGKVLATSLEFYREKLRAHGVAVERSIDPAPTVTGDPDRLQQVLLNLIINAVDAMPAGGTLRVALTRPDADVVEVRVRDTGSGIDPEVVDRIFEPFYTTKKRGRGTGLGLVVAKGIVEEHHGEITVNSEVGGGTEFVIRLPSGTLEDP